MVVSNSRWLEVKVTKNSNKSVFSVAKCFVVIKRSVFAVVVVMKLLLVSRLIIWM